MTNRNNNSKTEPSGSIEAILEEFPDAEVVNFGFGSYSNSNSYNSTYGGAGGGNKSLK